MRPPAGEKTERPRQVPREAGVSTLARDVWTLAQLQVQMMAAESRETTRKLVLPAVLLAGGLAVALGCVPVLLLALASLLEAAGMYASAAQAVAAVVGVALSAGLAGGAWYGARQALCGLTETREALAENLASLRAAFSRHNGAPGK